MQTETIELRGADWIEIGGPDVEDVIVQVVSGYPAMVFVGAVAPEPGALGHYLSDTGDATFGASGLAGTPIYARAIDAERHARIIVTKG